MSRRRRKKKRRKSKFCAFSFLFFSFLLRRDIGAMKEMKNIPKSARFLIAFFLLSIGIEASNFRIQSRLFLSSSITRAASHVFGDHAVIAYGVEDDGGTKSLCRKYSEIVHNPLLDHIHRIRSRVVDGTDLLTLNEAETCYESIVQGDVPYATRSTDCRVSFAQDLPLCSNYSVSSFGITAENEEVPITKASEILRNVSSWAQSQVQVDEDLSFVRHMRESSNTVEEVMPDLREMGMERGWNSLEMMKSFHMELNDLANDASATAATWKSLISSMGVDVAGQLVLNNGIDEVIHLIQMIADENDQAHSVISCDWANEEASCFNTLSNMDAGMSRLFTALNSATTPISDVMNTLDECSENMFEFHDLISHTHGLVVSSVLLQSATSSRLKEIQMVRFECDIDGSEDACSAYALGPTVIDTSIENNMQTMADEIPQFWSSVETSSQIQCVCIQNAIHDHTTWYANASIVVRQGTMPSGMEVEEQMRLVSIRSTLPCRLIMDTQLPVLQFTSSECVTSGTSIECQMGSASVGSLYSMTQFMSIEPVSNNFFGEEVGGKITFMRIDESVLAPSIETWSLRDGSGTGLIENIGENDTPDFIAVTPRGVVEGDMCFNDAGFTCGPGLYCPFEYGELGYCAKVGYGFYSPDFSNSIFECENTELLNKRYLSEYESNPDCAWLCADPKHQKIEVAGSWQCVEIPIGYYLPYDSNDPLPCTMPVSYPSPFYAFVTNAVDDSCGIGPALQSYASIDQNLVEDAVLGIGGWEMKAWIRPNRTDHGTSSQLFGVKDSWFVGVSIEENNAAYIFFQTWNSSVESQFIGDSFPLSSNGNWIKLYATIQGLLTIAVDQKRIFQGDFTAPGSIGISTFHVGGLHPNGYQGYVDAIEIRPSSLSAMFAGWTNDDGMCDPILQIYQDGLCMPRCYFEDGTDRVSNHGCSLLTNMERCGDQLMEECPIGMIRTHDCSCICESGLYPIFSIDNVVIASEVLEDSSDNYYPTSTKDLGIQKILFLDQFDEEVVPERCEVSNFLPLDVSCEDLFASSSVMQPSWHIEATDGYLWIRFDFQKTTNISRVVVFNHESEAHAMKNVQLFTSMAINGFIPGNAIALTSVETIPLLDPVVHDTSFFLDGYSLLTQIPQEQSNVEIIQCVECSNDQTSYLSDTPSMGVQSCQCLEEYSRRRTHCVNPLHVASNLTSTAIPVGTVVSFNVTENIKWFDNVPLFHVTIIDSSGTTTEETFNPVFLPASLQTTHYAVAATQNGRNLSDLLEVNVDAKGYLQIELPLLVFDESPSTYEFTITKIPDSQEVVTVYYTEDGSSPDRNSTHTEDGHITLIAENGPVTYNLVLMATANYYFDAVETDGPFTVYPVVATPTINTSYSVGLMGGKYEFVDYFHVIVSSETPNATFEYNFWGDTESQQSPNGDIMESCSRFTDSPTTFFVKGLRDGFESSEALYIDVIIVCSPEEPFFSLESGNVPFGMTIDVSSPTVGATVECRMGSSEINPLDEYTTMENFSLDTIGVYAVECRSRQIKSGFSAILNSDSVLKTYSVKYVPDPPTIFPSSPLQYGCFNLSIEGENVIISMNNGTSWMNYTQPMELCPNEDMEPLPINITVQATQYPDGPYFESDLATITYTIYPRPGHPIASQVNGTTFYKRFHVEYTCERAESVPLYQIGSLSTMDIHIAESDMTVPSEGLDFTFENGTTIYMFVACFHADWIIGETTKFVYFIDETRYPSVPSVNPTPDGTITQLDFISIACLEPNCTIFVGINETVNIENTDQLYEAPFHLPIGIVSLDVVVIAPNYDGDAQTHLEYYVREALNASHINVEPANMTQFWGRLVVNISSFDGESVFVHPGSSSATFEDQDAEFIPCEQECSIEVNETTVLSIWFTKEHGYPDKFQLDPMYFIFNETLRPPHAETPVPDSELTAFLLEGEMDFKSSTENSTIHIRYPDGHVEESRTWRASCSGFDDEEFTLRIWASCDGIDDSDPLILHYALVCPPQSPEFNPPAGIFGEMVSIIVETGSKNEMIVSYYAINETVDEDSLNEGDISLSLGTYVVHAKNKKTSYGYTFWSEETTAIYHVLPKCSAPLLSHYSGEFDRIVDLDIALDDERCPVIACTMNGIEYQCSRTNEITFDPALAPNATEIEFVARAIGDGMFPSTAVRREFVINPKCVDLSYATSKDTAYREAVITLRCVDGSEIDGLQMTIENGETLLVETNGVSEVDITISRSCSFSGKCVKEGWMDGDTTESPWFTFSYSTSDFAAFLRSSVVQRVIYFQSHML
eukprot:TRINITY_DN2581_c0_g1_i11.p2 TRINITY_DN2581_c0_g1~~TRINITY_DN2581_c0_g1_i11.p2  ORF type:complete len:2273 (-),score=514.19 TRINITY_DN2581_c0_g1_i11:14016-20834(-)